MIVEALAWIGCFVLAVAVVLSVTSKVAARPQPPPDLVARCQASHPRNEQIRRVLRIDDAMRAGPQEWDAWWALEAPEGVDR